MVIHLLHNKIKSDCYYSDYDYGDFSPEMLTRIKIWAENNNVQLEEFSTTDFQSDPNDVSINEKTCRKRVLIPDGKIYYCPGFVQLNDPICKIEDYREEAFSQYLEDMYHKKLFMCTGKELLNVNRFCPVKDKCDKKMCYYLNKKITGDNRFPFSNYCITKENKYKRIMDTKNMDTLQIVLDCLIKQNEAILTLGTANPNPIVKNRLGQLVNEVNHNLETILSTMEGEKDEEESRTDKRSREAGDPATL